MLCGYKGWFKNRPGAIRHVFGLHAYVFQYTAAENNPVNGRRASGNLQALFRDRIERGRQWALAPVERKWDANRQWQQVKHDTILAFTLRTDSTPAHWPPLAQIDTLDSETFCRGCSAAIGWLLEQDWSPEQIRATRRQLIPKRK